MESINFWNDNPETTFGQEAESDNLVTCRIFHRFDTSQENLHLYHSTAKRKKPFTGTPPEPPAHTETTHFSRTARARLYFFLENTAPVYKSQFVGTYHNQFPEDGRELYNHLDRFKKVLKRKKIRYCYVKEFQTRGVPHVHFYLDAEYSEKLWKHLGAAWHRIAGYGSEKHREWHVDDVRKNNKTGKEERSLIPWTMQAAYPCKYLTKEAQKDIPENYKGFGSFWGHSRDLKPEIQYEISAQKIQEEFDREEQFNPDTGEIVTEERKAYTQLNRILGKYDEKRRGKKYSYYRTTARSSMVHGGTKIIEQTLNYWRKEDGKLNKENDRNNLQRFSGSPGG